ncbi:protein adenylyltransferase SelO [Alteromonas facilis]|uniref:protein adenylyltransferase SelO n=1 Tax=Alteromonas facilis TaxID=2048004 RepID=UPI000C289429|nr:YdiU family protein [Alteromonas facilis]
MQLSYTYANELQALTSSVSVHPLKGQRLAMTNHALSGELGIADSVWQGEWQALLNDKQSPWQRHAVAQKYGGHQFGQWNPYLGDGRGHLLAEITSSAGARLDLHLKGAGPTPYSRHADGRAVLRSTIREYMISEAMHALGVPTSRALCLFTSNEGVQRETLEPGAMLIRTCPSHIRFGHFEYFHYSGQKDELDALFEYCFKHHFADLADTDNKYQALLQQIVTSTAWMIAHWQSLGFNHGVMNTDNMSIHGITFDYGPYAFLDDFNPQYICNHSDHNGRYAFDQQPGIALWNLNALAQAFTGYIDVNMITEALSLFEPTLIRSYHQLMNRKFGFPHSREEHAMSEKASELRQRWFQMLQQQQRDHSISFRLLSSAQSHPQRIIDHFIDRQAISQWLKEYTAILEKQNVDATDLDAINPRVVPRNHILQSAIEAAYEDDFSLCEALFEAITHPFSNDPQYELFAQPPADNEKGLALSCSS